MELVFLGHQSWVVRKNSTTILIDPLLCDTFGADPLAGFRIYPPRTVDITGLGPITAVFLSHEHSDHFDLPSIAALPAGTPVYVGCTVSSAITDAIETLGYPTKRVPGRGTVEVGDLIVDLYSAGSGTVFWESRVRQLLIQSRDDVDESVFIAVDALVSETFANDLNRSAVGKPRIIAVSNNSQVAPRGLYGTLDNLAVSDDTLRSKNGLVGIELLHGILIDYLRGLPDAEMLLICGGGFMKAYDAFGPYMFSDQDTMGEIADGLSLGTRISGPLPGDRYTLAGGTPIRQDRVDWVVLDREARQALRALSDAFKAAPSSPPLAPRAAPFADRATYAAAVTAVEAELARLGPALAMVPAGAIALGLPEYRGRCLDAQRIVLRFLGETHADQSASDERVFVFDFARGGFVAVPGGRATADLVERYPFGLEMHLADFFGMITGEFQIWDLVGISIRSWYVGNIFDGLVPLFYTFYGENIDVANATKLLTRRAKELVKVSSCA